MEFTKRPDLATLPALQEFQDLHDRIFHPDVHAMPLEKRLAHIHFHISKALGALGNYLEKRDHGQDTSELYDELKQKYIPDLLSYAIILSKIIDIEPAEAYFNRIWEIEARELTKK